MIGGYGAHRFEKGPTGFESRNQCLITGDWEVGDFFKIFDMGAPTWKIKVNHGVRAECGQDTTIPTGFPDLPMIFK